MFGAIKETAASLEMSSFLLTSSSVPTTDLDFTMARTQQRYTTESWTDGDSLDYPEPRYAYAYASSVGHAVRFTS
jgi:hypothetical protein